MAIAVHPMPLMETMPQEDTLLFFAASYSAFSSHCGSPSLPRTNAEISQEIIGSKRRGSCFQLHRSVLPQSRSRSRLLAPNKKWAQPIKQRAVNPAPTLSPSKKLLLERERQQCLPVASRQQKMLSWKSCWMLRHRLLPPAHSTPGPRAPDSGSHLPSASSYGFSMEGFCRLS